MYSCITALIAYCHHSTACRFKGTSGLYFKNRLTNKKKLGYIGILGKILHLVPFLISWSTLTALDMNTFHIWFNFIPFLIISKFQKFSFIPKCLNHLNFLSKRVTPSYFTSFSFPLHQVYAAAKACYSLNAIFTTYLFEIILRLHLFHPVLLTCLY